MLSEELRMLNKSAFLCYTMWWTVLYYSLLNSSVLQSVVSNSVLQYVVNSSVLQSVVSSSVLQSVVSIHKQARVFIGTIQYIKPTLHALKYEHNTHNRQHVSGILDCHHQGVFASVKVVSLELVRNVMPSHSIIQSPTSTVSYRVTLLVSDCINEWKCEWLC
jgi:hypothetical protein